MRKRWTTKEISTLIEHYPSASKDQLLKLLPDRTWQAIISAAKELRKQGYLIRRDGYWTAGEISLLKQLYSTENREVMLKLLSNRNWKSIQAKTHKLKLPRKCRSYTPILERLPNLNLKEEEKSWIAAAIDFEGTISFHRQYKSKSEKSAPRMRPYIVICNINIDLLRRFVELCNIPTIVEKRPKPNRVNWSQAWLARTHNQADIYAILKEVHPYLIAKKRQAELIMEFIEIQSDRLKQIELGKASKYTPRQFEIFCEVRNLNRRGGHRH